MHYVSDSPELIEYTTAEHLATTFTAQTKALRTALEVVGAACGVLRREFASDYYFNVGLDHAGRRRNADDSDIDSILYRMKLEAWRAILEKINIRRFLSSSRAKELDESLDGKGKEFPDITAESIQSVVAGYAMSVNEFLEEAVVEEYDFWKPSQARHDYKRNSFAKINRKIIRGWIVSPGYGKQKFRCNYNYQQHVTALDNVMHLLDGQGATEEYKGELASAIELSENGIGETKYFKFRCYKNGNIHLEFRREDLLARFNLIAGRNRLGGWQVKFSRNH